MFNFSFFRKVNSGCKVLFVIMSCFICMILSSNIVFAENYNVIGYEKAIIVNENNTYDVTTNIEVRPLAPQIMFEYKIPTRTQDNNKIIVNNIEVKNAEFKKETKRNYIILKIIDNNAIISKTYSITYHMNAGDNYDKKNDDIELMILPDNINSSISNLSFSLIMPSSYDYSKMQLDTFTNEESTYRKLSLANDFKYKYNNESRVFTATYKNKVNFLEGLRVKIFLPEGYFKNTRNNILLNSIITIIAIIVFVIVLIYFFIIGRDENLLAGVIAKTLNDFSPAYVAMLTRLCDDSIKSDDIKDIETIFISTILSWANKGYITIKENCVNNLNGDKNMIVTKLVDLNDNNMPISDRILMEGLFQLGDGNVVDFRVVKSEVEANSFSWNEKKARLVQYIDAFKEHMNDFVYKNYESGKNKKLDKAFNLLKVVPLATLNIVNIITAINDYAVIFDLIYPIFYLGLSVFVYKFLNKDDSKFVVKALCSDLVLFIVGFWIKINLFPYILLSLSTLLFIVVRKYEFSLLEQLKRISGFRNLVIRNNRKALVDALVENDLYFYDVLPYALALDLKAKWITKCFEFKIRTPEWYVKNENSGKSLCVQNIDRFIEEFNEFAYFIYANSYDIN